MYKNETQLTDAKPIGGDYNAMRIFSLGVSCFKEVWKKEKNHIFCHDSPDFYEALFKFLKKEYNAYVIEKAKESGGRFLNYQRDSATQLIQEAIKRGFVHSLDFVADAKFAHIRITKFSLIYPKNFPSQIEALKVQHKIGIPGITGTSSPLTK